MRKAKIYNFDSSSKNSDRNQSDISFINNGIDAISSPYEVPQKDGKHYSSILNERTSSRAKISQPQKEYPKNPYISLKSDNGNFIENGNINLL